MSRDEILKAFDGIRVWRQGERRAVHKPLLVLYALAKVNAGAATLSDWNDAEPALKELLEEFGPDDFAAFALVIQMLVITLRIRIEDGFFRTLKGDGMEVSVLLTVMCVAVLPGGGGRWSLDRKIGREF